MKDLIFKVDLEQLKKHLRIKAETELVKQIEGLVEQAQKIARPKVCYRVAYVESKADEHLVIEETQFTRSILRTHIPHHSFSQ